MRAPAAVALLLAFVGGGSLGTAVGEDTVLNFAEVSARHFHALSVSREYGAPSDRPLVLYVDLLGDDRDADLAPAYAWLAEHLDIVVRERAGGLPLYLTKRDLVGSQGNDALGATVPSGIVVETRSADLLGCALAHEVGHALGLKHSTDRSSIMWTRCDYGKLDRATVSDAERAHVDRIRSVEALTLSGRILWAHRA